MHYEIEISENARAQLKALPRPIRQRIGYRLTLMQEDLTGDVKKLHDKEYRLRVGSYRVLFRLNANIVEVYAVKDRKDAYA